MTLYSACSMFLLVVPLLLLSGCKEQKKEQPVTNDSDHTNGPAMLEVAKIEAYDDSFRELVPEGAGLEILATGHEWTEGPLWVPADSMLLYTDIPRNAIYRWREGEGSAIYLQPSGFLGSEFSGKEPGANGLLLDEQGMLVLCQHGERQVARMRAPINKPVPEFDTLARTYNGKRFNSPNDATFKSDGSLYFTDPPYGLPGQMDDPAKELDFQGVYRLGTDGRVSLLTKELSRPNGIAFSRDEQTLYVANSDPQRAIWMAYEVTPDGLLQNGRILYDATGMVPEKKGLPDGLKVHRSGAIFATGPGGVMVFSAEGKLLGHIFTGQATSNCTFDADERYLYITADSYLLRLAMR